MDAPNLHAQSTLDEVLHALIAAGIMAASIFVKNPASRELAGNLINITNQTLLPLADGLLNPTPSATTALPLSNTAP